SRRVRGYAPTRYRSTVTLGARGVRRGAPAAPGHRVPCEGASGGFADVAVGADLAGDLGDLRVQDAQFGAVLADDQVDVPGAGGAPGAGLGAGDGDRHAGGLPFRARAVEDLGAGVAPVRGADLDDLEAASGELVRGPLGEAGGARAVVDADPDLRGRDGLHLVLHRDGLALGELVGLPDGLEERLGEGAVELDAVRVLRVRLHRDGDEPDLPGAHPPEPARQLLHDREREPVVRLDRLGDGGEEVVGASRVGEHALVGGLLDDRRHERLLPLDPVEVGAVAEAVAGPDVAEGLLAADHLPPRPQPQLGLRVVDAPGHADLHAAERVHDPFEPGEVH